MWYWSWCNIAGRVNNHFFCLFVSVKVIRKLGIFTVASHSFQNVKELLKYQEPVVTLNTDICWYLFSTFEWFYAC